jgi:hypothetical protein
LPRLEGLQDLDQVRGLEDCHAGFGGARKYALSTGRRTGGLFKESRDTNTGSRALLSRCRGHHLAILVHQGWAPHCRIRRW